MRSTQVHATSFSVATKLVDRSLYTHMPVTVPFSSHSKPHHSHVGTRSLNRPLSHSENFSQGSLRITLLITTAHSSSHADKSLHRSLSSAISQSPSYLSLSRQHAVTIHSTNRSVSILASHSHSPANSFTSTHSPLTNRSGSLSHSQMKRPSKGARTLSRQSVLTSIYLLTHSLPLSSPQAFSSATSTPHHKMSRPFAVAQFLQSTSS
jgi:hypothetical protein